MAHSEVVSQRLVRWLGLAVLAVALVVECTSEVDSLNEGASKWVWSPEGSLRAVVSIFVCSAVTV